MVPVISADIHPEWKEGGGRGRGGGGGRDGEVGEGSEGERKGRDQVVRRGMGRGQKGWEEHKRGGEGWEEGWKRTREEGWKRTKKKKETKRERVKDEVCGWRQQGTSGKLLRKPAATISEDYGTNTPVGNGSG